MKKLLLLISVALSVSASAQGPIYIPVFRDGLLMNLDSIMLKRIKDSGTSTLSISDFKGDGITTPISIDTSSFGRYLRSLPGWSNTINKSLRGNLTWAIDTGNGAIITPTPVQEYLTLTNRSATVTESPAHTFTGIADLLDNKYIAANDTGYIAMQYNNVATQGVAIGMDNYSVVNNFDSSSIGRWNYVAYFFNGLYERARGESTATLLTDFASVVADSYICLYKTISGSNMTISVRQSTDGGATFPTVLHNFSPAAKADLFLKFSITTSGSNGALKNPVGFNLKP